MPGENGREMEAKTSGCPWRLDGSLKKRRNGVRGKAWFLLLAVVRLV